MIIICALTAEVATISSLGFNNVILQHHYSNSSRELKKYKDHDKDHSISKSNIISNHAAKRRFISASRKLTKGGISANVIGLVYFLCFSLFLHYFTAHINFLDSSS